MYGVDENLYTKRFFSVFSHLAVSRKDRLFYVIFITAKEIHVGELKEYFRDCLRLIYVSIIYVQYFCFIFLHTLRPLRMCKIVCQKLNVART